MRFSPLVIGAALSASVAANSWGQTTQPAVLSYSGPSSLQLGQSMVVTVSLSTATNPGSICLSSFAAQLTATSGLTITDWARAPGWDPLPTDPFVPAVGGFSLTPRDGDLALWTMTVRADALGMQQVGFTQPAGDNRFVWNGTYLPPGSTDRVSCFIAPTGSFAINVVPSPGAFALLGLGGVVAIRRRR